MSDDKSKVVRVVYPVYPVVERTHAKILEDGGFLNKDGYLDLLALIHATMKVERQFQMKITIAAATLGVLGGLALKYLL